MSGENLSFLRSLTKHNRPGVEEGRECRKGGVRGRLEGNSRYYRACQMLGGEEGGVRRLEGEGGGIGRCGKESEKGRKRVWRMFGVCLKVPHLLVLIHTYTHPHPLTHTHPHLSHTLTHHTHPHPLSHTQCLQPQQMLYSFPTKPCPHAIDALCSGSPRPGHHLSSLSVCQCKRRDFHLH